MNNDAAWHIWVTEGGVTHVVRSFKSVPGYSCFCTVHDHTPVIENRLMTEDDVVTCFWCVINLFNRNNTDAKWMT